jgi:hypothetical protein
VRLSNQIDRVAVAIRLPWPRRAADLLQQIEVIVRQGSHTGPFRASFHALFQYTLLKIQTHYLYSEACMAHGRPAKMREIGEILLTAL